MDLNHPELRDMVWKNLKERKNQRDDDRNGYIDDLVGWNFVDKSAKTFFHINESSFDTDIPRYYRLRAKRHTGQLSEEEQAFYDERRKDDEFKENKKKFSSYIHGTHIAGIATKRENLPREIYNQDVPFRFLSIRYLGKNQDGKQTSPQFSPLTEASYSKKMAHVNKFIDDSKYWQTNKLEKAVAYVSEHVEVINGSFGRTLVKIKATFVEAYEDQFGKKPSDQWADDTANTFMNDILQNVEDVAKKHPHILFVFSAGNKKENNDLSAHYPSNAKARNIISVAASNGIKELAKFSNFGKDTVHVMAPGVAITSLTPGRGEKLPASGTSQAAPYVANVAIKAFTLAQKKNFKLSPSKLRKILIGTVIKNDIFRNKSQSEGVVSPIRVYEVIRRISRGEKLSRAIKMANKIAQESKDF